MEDWTHFFNTLLDYAVEIAFKLVAAGVVYLIGHWIIKALIKKLRNAKKLQAHDPTVQTFVNNLVKFSLYTILLISVVAILGVPMASVITLLASFGAAIALAVKGAFSNLVGGIMILFFKPFGVGEYVDIAGKAGTVEEVGIFYTQLKTGDNLTVSVPNGKIVDSVLVNYSRKDTRRLDLTLDVAYGTDIEKAKTVIGKVLDAHNAALKDPAPFIRMTAMKDSSIEITVRVWCEKANYGTLKSDFLEAIDKAFAATNIEVPFPQLEIRAKK